MAAMAECNNRAALAVMKLLFGHHIALFSAWKSRENSFLLLFFFYFLFPLKSLYKFMRLRTSPPFIQQAGQPREEVEKTENCRQGRK
jgi:hypothetical protein